MIRTPGVGGDKPLSYLPIPAEENLLLGIGGGVHTSAFVFTSLLTIPEFNNIALYALAVTAAFLTSMILVIVFDYRTPE